VACGEALKRKTASIEQKSQAPPTKVVTVTLTEIMFEKIKKMRRGVSISDYIAELVAEHLKKQKKIPPEVFDMAEIS
jgi:predicted CopG family antitoxin